MCCLWQDRNSSTIWPICFLPLQHYAKGARVVLVSTNCLMVCANGRISTSRRGGEDKSYCIGSVEEIFSFINILKNKLCLKK